MMSWLEAAEAAELSEVVDTTEDTTEVTTSSQPSWNDTHSWVKLASIADLPTECLQRTLTVRPRYHTYLTSSEAGYDWAVGKEFIVIDRTSQYCGQIIAVDDTSHLVNSGYTHVDIVFNHNKSVEVEL